jgi:asparagine synthase (glutamine-hydrolysing)
VCGIVGALNFDGSPVSAEVVDAMRDLEVHRGPDDAGTRVEGPVGMGFRRLAIIDLSDCGAQPMSNEDGSVWIVFNGEIYNFEALREELIARGHAFRSRTDTEVIVHLYEEMGPKVVTRLRGMFAFAIWDSRQRQLVLARDRVGKKPLFYHRDGRGIRFASEARSLFADPAVPREADYLAIHHYLTFQYVPSPMSAFRDIHSLDPGHLMVVSADGAERTERYWRLDYRDKLDISEGEAMDRARELILEATRLRMIADVPLGAFLSGGVDSSVVVAAMAMQSSGPVRTFTIGFKEQAYDEAPYARMVAQRYSTDHTELVVEPDAIAMLPKLVWHYGNPFADSSALPTYYVSEMTRRYVTVALNGDGGDESFGGYTRYADFLRWTMFSGLPGGLKSALLGAAKAIPVSTHPIPRKARRAGEVFFGPPADRYAELIAYFQTRDKDRMYTPEFQDRVREHDSADIIRRAWAEAAADTDTDRLLATDVETYLPDDLLVKVDIASMAVSLEARSPLLDHELMEFAARLPARFKVRGRETKYLLKKVADTMVPPEVVHRPKMGFGVPIAHWFRDELADYLREVLLDPGTIRRGLFRADAIEAEIDAHQSGRGDYALRLWALLMLELWFRTYIDRSPVSGPI